MNNEIKPHDQGLLKAGEAAAYLGVAESTIRTWAYENRISYVKFGGRKGPIRFRITDLEQYIEDHLILR